MVNQEQKVDTFDWKKYLSGISIASVLRYLGALFVVGSGIIYLLQGLVDTNLNLRYWAYLAFMSVLIVGGLFSHRYMQDNKGARMFFGLAILIVPVQFTQLGSVFFDHFHQLIDVIPVWQLSIFIGLSVVIGAVATFSSLSILARPYAKKLSAYFLIFNGLLLLPQREMDAIFILVILMAVAYFMLLLNVFNRDHRFNLIDGHAVKIILLVPLIIVVVRSGFFISTDLGISLMFLVAAFVLNGFYKVLVDFPKLAKAVAFSSFVLFFGAWFTVVDQLDSLFAISNVYESFIVALPIVMMAIKQDIQAKGLPIYRLIAGMTLVFNALSVFSYDNMFAILCLAVIATCVVVYALQNQSLLLLTTSIGILLISLVRIVSISIGQIDLNVWFGAAIFGVLLVAASSVIERYGHMVKTKLSDSIYSLKQWRY